MADLFLSVALNLQKGTGFSSMCAKKKNNRGTYTASYSQSIIKRLQWSQRKEIKNLVFQPTEWHTTTSGCVCHLCVTQMHQQAAGSWALSTKRWEKSIHTKRDQTTLQAAALERRADREEEAAEKDSNHFKRQVFWSPEPTTDMRPIISLRKECIRFLRTYWGSLVTLWHAY